MIWLETHDGTLLDLASGATVERLETKEPGKFVVWYSGLPNGHPF